MKKLYFLLSLSAASIASHSYAMLNKFPRKIMSQSTWQIKPQSTFRMCSTPTDSPTIEISEKCYHNWLKMGKDAAKLKCFFEATFESMAQRNIPTVKPSQYLKWLGGDYALKLNKDTDLSYMPASMYLDIFVGDHLEELDQVFSTKYEETKDVAKTWHFFNNYFIQNVLHKNIENFGKQMMEKDAARITLAKEGIHFTSDTLILDGDAMSTNSENMKTVKNAFDTLFRNKINKE